MARPQTLPLMWSPTGKCFYVIRSSGVQNDRPARTVYLHRFLLGLDYGDPLEGDHIDTWNTLDNERKI